MALTESTTMFSKLFSRRVPDEKPVQAQLSPGERVYAIGDIHGRHDLLVQLLARIEADDVLRGGDAGTLIFLGDLVDRGPESAQVVETLMHLSKRRPEGKTRFLLGNHEEVFLAVLAGDSKVLKFFDRIGGGDTILSYGVSKAAYKAASYEELLTLVLDAVPEDHVEFLQSFEDMIVVGDYVFVHAGVRPGQPLNLQRSNDLRWIRADFLGHRGRFEKIVVHGHTISDEVEVMSNRIGLDTGAFQSGRLTAMGFEGSSRWVLQTGVSR
ncbi:MAG TPA: metallophosphoesterase family protein [Sphingomonas sp.]